MRTIILSLIIMISLQLEAQTSKYTKCETKVIGGDTVTTKIILHKAPVTEIQFESMLDRLRTDVRFKEGSTDGLSFWLYVIRVNSSNSYDGYEMASRLIIKQMNEWLEDNYKQ